MIISNPYILFGGAILFVAVILALVYILVPMAVKKGLPVEKVLTTADKDLDIIHGAVDTVSKIVPIPQIAIIDKVLDYAKVGVQQAEQLFKIGQIDKDARKDEAKAYILNTLKVAGVEVTPELKKVIDGAIQAGVFILPRTGLVSVAKPVEEEKVSITEPIKVESKVEAPTELFNEFHKGEYVINN